MEIHDELAYHILNGMEPQERAHFVEVIRSARVAEVPLRDRTTPPQPIEP